jgi:hypothetical protein
MTCSCTETKTCAMCAEIQKFMKGLEAEIAYCEWQSAMMEDE